jgi:mercuric ion binding protein
MKTLQLFIISFLFISATSFAQTKTETIRVNGECGTCKKKIETAAKNAGASYANWNADTKQLTVKYSSSSSNAAKIEKSIANAGYDTQDVKATDEAYNKLDDCCKYDRTANVKGTAMSCCDDKKCTDAKCMKDGKCTSDMSCCKEAGCDKKACCAKS